MSPLPPCAPPIFQLYGASPPLPNEVSCEKLHPVTPLPAPPTPYVTASPVIDEAIPAPLVVAVPDPPAPPPV